MFRWIKKVGDPVAIDEVILEIETDKTALPVTSPTNGIIEEALVADGTTVKAGQEVVKVKVTDGAPPPKAAAAEAAPPAAAPTPAPGKFSLFDVTFMQICKTKNANKLILKLMIGFSDFNVKNFINIYI